MASKYYQNKNCEQNNSNGNGLKCGKSWHISITTDKRSEVEHKILQAIFPTPSPAALRDRRMCILRAYARKVEVEMYCTASSREEYYLRIAEKIYRIKEEIKKKRRERNQLRQFLPSSSSSHTSP